MITNEATIHQSSSEGVQSMIGNRAAFNVEQKTRPYSRLKRADRKNMKHLNRKK